jgi:hypothetical protein
MASSGQCSRRRCGSCDSVVEVPDVLERYFPNTSAEEDWMARFTRVYGENHQDTTYVGVWINHFIRSYAGALGGARATLLIRYGMQNLSLNDQNFVSHSSVDKKHDADSDHAVDRVQGIGLFDWFPACRTSCHQ